MSKRYLSIILSLSLLFSMISAASAAGEPKLSFQTDDVSVVEDERIHVILNLENNPGFHALQVNILYDDSAFVCESISAGSLLTQDGVFYDGNPDADSMAIIAAMSLTEISGDGALVDMVFQATSPGTHDLELEVVCMERGTEQYTPDTAPLSIKVDSVSDVNSGSTSTAPIVPEEEIPPLSPPDESPAVNFSDVPVSHWAYTYVQNAVKNGLFSGIGNGMFGPAMNVTRGMFVTTLYSSAGSPDVELSNFTDVPANAWYAKAVAWASQQGIVSGIGNNMFGPDMPITREQIALILFNYADGVSPGTEMFVRMAYPDAKDIHDWALTAFTWAMNKDLISGKSGNILDPLATATRAEVAVIMQNFVNLSK